MSEYLVRNCFRIGVELLEALTLLTVCATWLKLSSCNMLYLYIGATRCSAGSKTASRSHLSKKKMLTFEIFKNTISNSSIFLPQLITKSLVLFQIVIVFFKML